MFQPLALTDHQGTRREANPISPTVVEAYEPETVGPTEHRAEGSIRQMFDVLESRCHQAPFGEGACPCQPRLLVLLYFAAVEVPRPLIKRW